MTPGLLIPGTPEWYENRRHVVTASECPLILGIPVYGGRTVSDLWWEKRYGVSKESKGNASTVMGTELEPNVLRFAESKLGEIIDRQRWYENSPNGGTLDGRVADTGAVVEAKTSGVLGPSTQHLWGPDDSDEVLDQYLVQCQVQLIVTGAELAYLAALIGGRGYSMFQIRPDLKLQAIITQKSDEFLQSLADDNPPPEPPQLDTLKRIRREPNKVLPRSDRIDELRDRFESAKTSAKATEDAKELAQRELLALLGDAEAAEVDGGLLTYFEQTTRYPPKPLASESTYRVLRFKRGG